MPRATQQEQTNEPLRPPGQPATHDDDRGAAHRASMAGLRREAAQLAAPSSDDQRRQHDKADAASFQALESSMALVNAKLFAASHEIQRLVQLPKTNAGYTPVLKTIESMASDLVSDMTTLDHHLALVSHDDGPNYGMTSHAPMLDRQLGGLRIVVDMFRAAVNSAKPLAKSDGVPFEPNLKPMAEVLDNIRVKIGKPIGEAITHRVVETRSETSMRGEAIEANLHAVVEAARAVRAQAHAKNDRTATGDLQMMLRHVAELDSLVGQVSDRHALHKLAPRIRQALDEVAEVGHAVAGTPSLDIAFRYSAELPHHLRSLRAKAAG